MLVPLGLHPDRGDGPDGLLLACHDRIRTFTSMATRLASGGDAPPDRVRDAAERLLRYFRDAFPLHHDDEEESVMPRLRASGDAALAGTLDVLSAQHGEIVPLVEALVELWKEARERPGDLAARTDRLGPPTARLAEILGAHLEIEESVMIPAVSRLPAGEREAIVREMRARRGA